MTAHFERRLWFFAVTTIIHNLHFKCSHDNVNNNFLCKISVDSSIVMQHSHNWTGDADDGLCNGVQQNVLCLIAWRPVCQNAFLWHKTLKGLSSVHQNMFWRHKTPTMTWWWSKCPSWSIEQIQDILRVAARGCDYSKNMTALVRVQSTCWLHDMQSYVTCTCLHFPCLIGNTTSVLFCVVRMFFDAPTFALSNKAHLIACRCKAHVQRPPFNHSKVAWWWLSQQQSHIKKLALTLNWCCSRNNSMGWSLMCAMESLK